MKRIFLARPSYGPREPETDYAARYAITDHDNYQVIEAAFQKSMTCHNFNDHLSTCMNHGGCDYFVMQHADVAPDYGFAQRLVEASEELDLDINHAPCTYKNDTDKAGLTTTALCYSDAIWGPNRRLSLAELGGLPKAFDIDVIKSVFDPEAIHILPNTGCMALRLGDWIEKFPGFQMVDQFGRDQNDVWACRSVSEDYWIGHWAAKNGLRVGATKIGTDHWGRKRYTTKEVWGMDRDEEFFKATQEAAVA